MTLPLNKWAVVLGRVMLEHLLEAGFHFDDESAALTFFGDEFHSPLNVSRFFATPCDRTLTLYDCINQTDVSIVFDDAMGKYMQNRLIFVLPLIYCIAVLSLVSNVLGLRAVIGIRHKLPRHWVLMNLSIADGILAPLNAIKVTSEVLANSTFDIYFRQYFNSIWQVFFLLCPLSLFFLALDNLVAVVAPFFYERHSGSAGRVAMLSAGATAWLSIILFIGLLHAFSVQSSQTVQVIVATVLLVIIAITVTLYLGLALKAEMYRRQLLGIALPSSVQHQKQREMLRSRMKTTATTLSIVLTLAVFWSPFCAYLLISGPTKFANVPFFIHFLCVALSLFQLGTAVEPIVYCCRMVEVRRSLFTTVVPKSWRECLSKHVKQQQSPFNSPPSVVNRKHETFAAITRKQSGGVGGVTTVDLLLPPEKTERKINDMAIVNQVLSDDETNNLRLTVDL